LTKNNAPRACCDVHAEVISAKAQTPGTHNLLADKLLADNPLADMSGRINPSPFLIEVFAERAGGDLTPDSAGI